MNRLQMVQNTPFCTRNFWINTNFNAMFTACYSVRILGTRIFPVTIRIIFTSKVLLTAIACENLRSREYLNEHSTEQVSSLLSRNVRKLKLFRENF